MTVVLHAPLREHGAALLLRPWSEQDISELIAAHRDPVMRRWSSVHITDYQDARRWLDVQRIGWSDGDRLSFAVVAMGLETDGHRLVANVAVKGLAEGKAHAEIGYWTAAWARGRGIAVRAVETLTAWAFENFSILEFLQLLHQVDNHASCRVAQKSGYALEGVLPAEPPSFPNEGHVHVRRSLNANGTC